MMVGGSPVIRTFGRAMMRAAGAPSDQPAGAASLDHGESEAAITTAGCCDEWVRYEHSGRVPVITCPAGQTHYSVSDQTCDWRTE